MAKKTLETTGETKLNFNGKDYKISNNYLLYGFAILIAIIFYKIIFVIAIGYGLYKFVEYKQKQKATDKA